MKSLIIYSSSHHKNTEKVADTMAKYLKSDVLKVEDAKNISFEEYDLIGLGSGIYYGKHDSKLNDIIENSNIKDKKCFVFSTSGSGKERYNRHMIDLLLSKGAIVKSNFACKGYDTLGPLKWIGGIAKEHPSESDLKNAENFIKSILV